MKAFIGALRPVLLVGVLVVASCAGGADPEPAFPAGFEGCDETRSSGFAPPCLDAVEAQLDSRTRAAATTGPVSVDRFLEIVATVSDEARTPLGRESEYTLLSNLGYPLDTATSTEPVVTRWRIDTSDRLLWACLGDDPRVSTDPC